MTVRFSIEADRETAFKIADAIGRAIADTHAAQRTNERFTPSRRERLKAVPDSEPGALTAGGAVSTAAHDDELTPDGTDFDPGRQRHMAYFDLEYGEGDAGSVIDSCADCYGSVVLLSLTPLVVRRFHEMRCGVWG